MKAKGWFVFALLGLALWAGPSSVADARPFAFPAMDGWTLAGPTQEFVPDTL